MESMQDKTPSLFVPESHLRLAERPDGLVAVYLSKHLAGLLGQPQWIEFSVEPEGEVFPGVPFATIETGKTVYEVALPFAAAFSSPNKDALATPSLLVCAEVEGSWLCLVKPADGDWREGLLDADGYAAYTAP